MKTANIFLFLTTFILLTLCIAWYIGQEQYIYFWDYEGYHSSYRTLGSHLSQRPVEAIGSVFNSVRKSDYNTLPTLLQMPFYFSFGTSRMAYILSITVLFAFPTLILFSGLMKILHLEQENEQKLDTFLLLFIAIVVIGLSPQFWLPVLRGYVDVVGVGVIFIILTLLFRTELAEQPARTLITIGLLLSLVVLLRRWYAYWVTGFFVALGFTACVGVRHHRHPIANLRQPLTNIMIMGLVAVVSLFTLATPIAVHMATTDYRDMYSAYRQSDSLLFHIGLLIYQYGVLFLATSFLGFAKMVITEGRTQVALFLAAQFIVTFLLFTRTQMLGDHHYYWVSSILLIFTAFFWQELYSGLKRCAWKTAVVSALLTVSILNCLLVFHPDWQNLISPANNILSQLRRPPLKRRDLEQVHQLLLTLNTLTRDSDDTVYVLSSSSLLNESIVRSACSRFESTFGTLAEKILPGSYVDKRDGFPLRFFSARYVVVTDPVGYQLAPQDQRVVGLLAEQLFNRDQLGKAYERLSLGFLLEGNTRVYIYKRTKNFEAAAIKRLAETFVTLYPSQRDKFELTPETIQALSNS